MINRVFRTTYSNYIDVVQAIAELVVAPLKFPLAHGVEDRPKSDFNTDVLDYD